MSAKRLPVQNPVNLVGFLLVEFGTLSSIQEVFERLGTGFVDISSDRDVRDDWRDLGIPESDSPHMLKFDDGRRGGEMEVVFSDGRTVQVGVQVFSDPARSEEATGLFDALEAVIAMRFVKRRLTPTHVVFSDSHVNGYLSRTDVPGGGSVVLRLADSKWCESIYGPSIQIPAE